MKPFRWSNEKNEALKQERNISFESVVVAVESGGLLDVVTHSNPQRYPSQRIMLVAISGYVYLVPYVEDSDHIFLKTVIPSRKATRNLLLKVENS